MLHFEATAQNVPNSNSVVFRQCPKILNGLSHINEDRYEQADSFSEFVSLLAFKRAIARQNPSTGSQNRSELSRGGGTSAKIFLSDGVQIQHGKGVFAAQSEH